MLKTRIKASSINNLTDARYFAAWGVDWLGFDLNEGSENYTSPMQIHAIKAWIEGPKIVGELLLSDAQVIDTISEELNIDTVQVGTFTETEALSSYKVQSLIKEIVVESMDQLELLDDLFKDQKPYVECFLLDFNKNNISWESIKKDESILIILQQLCVHYNLLLDIDLSPGNIDDILASLNLYGFSIKGGAEEKVGFKSFDELDDIFEALETY